MTKPPLAGLAALLLVAGCHRPLETRAEHAITDLLPRYLGKADSYTARVGGRPDALLRGHVRTVHIEGINVALVPNLFVERLDVDIKDVSVDPETLRLQNVGETRFTARLTESVINAYVSRRPSTLKKAYVTLGADGKVTVTATPEVLGFTTLPVSLRGTAHVADGGTRLDFLPDKASVSVGDRTASAGFPAFVADHIASRLNPVADWRAAPLSVVAETVTVERGAVSITGYIPPGALQKAIADAAQRPN